MKALVFETAKMVGMASAESWSQAHVFSPETKEKRLSRGSLLAVFSLTRSGTGMEDLTAYGREALARFHEEYFGHLEGNALTRLKEAAGRVVAEFNRGMRLELTAVALVEGQAFLAVAGGGRVILKRGMVVADICRGEPGGVKISGGFFQEGDVVFLGTGELFEKLASGSLKAALMAPEPEEVAEILTPMIFGQKLSQAAVVAKVKEEEITLAEGSVVLKPAEEKRKRFLGKIKLWMEGFKERGRHWPGGGRRKIREPSLGKVRDWRGKRRGGLTVAAVSFLILAVSLTVGYFRQKSAKELRDQEAALAGVEEKIKSGLTLAATNEEMAYQILEEGGRTLSGLAVAEELKERKEELGQSLEKAKREVLKDYLVEPEVFFDLGIVKEGGRGDDFVLTQEGLLVLDGEQGSIYRVGTSEKEAAIVTGGERFKWATGITVFGKKVYVLAREGILEFDLNKKELTKAVEAEGDWAKTAELKAYGGNLYLLEKGKGNLYRYPAIEGGFAARQTWFKGEGEILKGGRSMRIDGSVWVLAAEGQVLKFSQGFSDPWEVKNLREPLQGTKALETGVELTRVYVLDQEGQRVVVADKEGNYLGQYRWPEGPRAEALVADEGEGKLWLLAKEKLFAVKLKS